MGLIPGAQGDTPQPKNIALDPGTQDISDRTVARASQDPSTYSGILNQNHDMARNLGQGDDQVSQESYRMGDSDPNQMKAIRNVYNQQANSGIQRLQDQNALHGRLMKADYMNTVSKALLGQQQQAVNQYQVLTNAFQQQEAARAGAVNSLFQVADVGIGQSMGSARQQVPKQANGAAMGGAQAGGQPAPYTNYEMQNSSMGAPMTNSPSNSWETVG